MGTEILQLMIGGFATGSIYALIALGFVLIYKATGILNFAQGELMMVGAYIYFALVTELQLPFLAAFLLTLVLSGILGLVLEFVFIERMVGEPVFSVVVITLGLASLLRSLTGIVFGVLEKGLATPFSGKSLAIGPLVIWQTHAYAIVGGVALFIIFMAFFKFSKTGIGMRAAAEDQDVARLMGINIGRVFGLSWIIAAVVASVGGIFYGDLSFLEPHMSFFGLRALPAALLGGLDSVGGALIGGLAIGLIEGLAGGYLGGTGQELAPWILVLVILMARPYGLFGTREIKRV
ncbi:MAG: branched-chain amino acid ABC transporter permease [Clostridia bacterium]|nr:MAG: branched-chain amino acid ABC transporter permease [Clostridia bacterium]